MGDITFQVTILCLTMNFKVIILVYQITIFSLLIEGSTHQSYEESSSTMDGCNMRDKMSSMHNEKHITFIKNITDVFECAFYCKVDAKCNFWTLNQDNEFCDLFGEEGDLREDINAISGSKDCGKATEKLCKNIGSFKKECEKHTDEEHCQELSENFFMHRHCDIGQYEDMNTKTNNTRADILITATKTKTILTTQTTTTAQTTTTTQATWTTQTTSTTQTTTTTITQTMQTSQNNPTQYTISSVPPTSPVCNEMFDAL